MSNKTLTQYNTRIAIKPDGTPALQRRNDAYYAGPRWEDIPVVYLDENGKEVYGKKVR